MEWSSGRLDSVLWYLAGLQITCLIYVRGQEDYTDETGGGVFFFCFSPSVQVWYAQRASRCGFLPIHYSLTPPISPPHPAVGSFFRPRLGVVPTSCPSALIIDDLVYRKDLNALVARLSLRRMVESRVVSLMSARVRKPVRTSKNAETPYNTGNWFQFCSNWNPPPSTKKIEFTSHFPNHRHPNEARLRRGCFMWMCFVTVFPNSPEVISCVHHYFDCAYFFLSYPLSAFPETLKWQIAGSTGGILATRCG